MCVRGKVDEDTRALNFWTDALLRDELLFQDT